MANDLVIQLLLKSGAFSNDLKTTKGQIQKFQVEVGKAGTAINSLGGGLGKVGSLLGKAGPWGAAALVIGGIGKAFKDSGIYADEFEAATQSVSGALDSLKFNLANFSWGNFIGDMINAAKVARDVANAVDNINTVLGANAPVKNVAWDRYQTAITKAQDKGYTKEQRQGFLEDAKRLGQEYLDSLRTEISQNEQKAIQMFKGYLGDVWGTFRSLSKEEQKKLITQGASGQWGFNDLLEEARKRAKELNDRHRSDARSNPSWSAVPSMVATDNARKAAEKYVKVLEKLVALENKSGDKPEILKTFQDVSEIYLRGGSIDNIEGTIDELIERTTASINREISQVQSRLNEKTPTTPKVSGGKSQAEREKEEREKQLKRIDEYIIELERDLMEARDRELDIEKAKYDEMIAVAEQYGRDTTQITELYNRKVVEINKKYDDILAENARKEEERRLKNIKDANDKVLSERKKLQKAQEDYNKAQITVTELKKNVKWEGLSIASGTIGNITSYVSAFKDLSESFDRAESGGEQFITVLQGIETAMNFVLSIVDIVNNVKNVINSISIAEQVEEQTKLAYVEQTRVTLEAELAAAQAGVVAANVAAIASVNTLAAAYTELAAAETMAANVAAAGPAGVATGAAEVAAMTASIVGAGATVGAFANGGIVGGNSFTGDRLTANVNSGEMILTRTQQSKLFRQINSNTTIGNGLNGEVTFHISGTDLVGVLNNNNRKSKLTR